jgi:hypothetical protein
MFKAECAISLSGGDHKIVVRATGSTTRYDSIPTFRGDDDGCFLATVAYGSRTAEQVEALKGFRDNTLVENSVGRAFIKSYYKVSPPLADYIISTRVINN